MHGIVSILDEGHVEKTLGVWELLEKELGLNKIRETPIPHFSWLIAEDYDSMDVDSQLSQLAKHSAPFIIRTNGMGVFSGIKPVLFIPVVKDSQLFLLHELIWEKISPSAKGLSPYYAPKSWMPHITLANKDLSPEKLGAATSLLANEKFDWEISIDNFAVIFQNEGDIGEERIRIQLSA